MPQETPGKSIPIEPGFESPGRAFNAVVARIDLPERTRALGMDRSTRDDPTVLAGADVAHNGGCPWRTDLPDVLAWIVPESEMEAFAAEAGDVDAEWGWFPNATLERQRGGDGGNLCLAMGTAKGVMDGFLVLRRGMIVETRTEVSYHFSFDRAYLLPRARGAGLAHGLVALASLVATDELDHVARAITPGRGKAALSVFLDGEAESAGGEWMLRSLADEFEDICDRIEEQYARVRIEGLEVDIDAYEPEDDSAPAP